MLKGKGLLDFVGKEDWRVCSSKTCKSKTLPQASLSKACTVNAEQLKTNLYCTIIFLVFEKEVYQLQRNK